jgi:hypothetical protein
LEKLANIGRNSSPAARFHTGSNFSANNGGSKEKISIIRERANTKADEQKETVNRPSNQVYVLSFKR